MDRGAIGEIGVAILALLAGGAAMAQELPPMSRAPAAAPNASRIIFGNNLLKDPCTTCNYSEGGGRFVFGPDNCILPDQTQWLAGMFIAAATGVPERISAPIILADPEDCPENQVTLSIYTDACYPTGPGTPLVSGVAAAVEGPCDLAVAKLRNSPILIQGKKYWVVATTTSQQSGLDTNWYGSNNAQRAFNPGTHWTQVIPGTPAFAVQGSGSTFSGEAPDASHAAFGGNLFVDPCTGCNYDSNISNGGVDVRGPENCTLPGQTNWEAVAFVAAKSGIPRRISAPILLRNPAFCPDNKVTLSIYTDNCGLGPGTPLVSGVATVAESPCDLAVVKLRNAPALEKSTKYWVVATTDASQSRLDATWYGSNASQFGANLGFGWIQFNEVTPGFLVQ